VEADTFEVLEEGRGTLCCKPMSDFIKEMVEFVQNVSKLIMDIMRRTSTKNGDRKNRISV
jgi:hypothetical protein